MKHVFHLIISSAIPAFTTCHQSQSTRVYSAVHVSLQTRSPRNVYFRNQNLCVHPRYREAPSFSCLAVRRGAVYIPQRKGNIILPYNLPDRLLVTIPVVVVVWWGWWWWRMHFRVWRTHPAPQIRARRHPRTADSFQPCPNRAQRHTFCLSLLPDP